MALPMGVSPTRFVQPTMNKLHEQRFVRICYDWIVHSSSYAGLDVGVGAGVGAVDGVEVDNRYSDVAGTGVQ